MILLSNEMVKVETWVDGKEGKEFVGVGARFGTTMESKEKHAHQTKLTLADPPDCCILPKNKSSLDAIDNNVLQKGENFDFDYNPSKGIDERRIRRSGSIVSRPLKKCSREQGPPEESIELAEPGLKIRFPLGTERMHTPIHSSNARKETPCGDPKVVDALPFREFPLIPAPEHLEILPNASAYVSNNIFDDLMEGDEEIALLSNMGDIDDIGSLGSGVLADPLCAATRDEDDEISSRAPQDSEDGVAKKHDSTAPFLSSKSIVMQRWGITISSIPHRTSSPELDGDVLARDMIREMLRKT
ncbi:hypothetical protein HHK36_001934 [Tetracentron sinense]|uniref:Uncharacterized protein n=1 Tax=Tetracentron sinense TaxID=13715 RepID=A0A835DRJ5_TETSI|nr:hypothetical protein HHK36_001934 [Tetracentron sinense]